VIASRSRYPHFDTYERLNAPAIHTRFGPEDPRQGPLALEAFNRRIRFSTFLPDVRCASHDAWRQAIMIMWTRTLLGVFFLSSIWTWLGDEQDARTVAPEGTRLVLIPGGTFVMGDAFGEGVTNERPLHEVTVSDFLLAEAEITVAQFARFVAETGYRTSAENPVDSALRDSLVALASDPGTSSTTRRALFDEVLRQGGCGRWDPERRDFDWGDRLNWKTPGFEQQEDYPVVCLSWDDAVAYANWVSRVDGLPEAYDLSTGSLLDGDGRPTSNVTQVRGYRLPTEAEWEFAARERGGDVRFGNGRNIADARHAAFDPSGTSYEYQRPGPVRRSPVAVRSYPPNALGLHDMAGNAWEWVSDMRAPYTAGAVSNPHQVSGGGRVVRGGRWGGDAFEMRVAKRFSWQSHNRCNASGFRLARSADAW